MKRIFWSIALLVSAFGAECVRCHAQQPSEIVYLDTAKDWRIGDDRLPIVRNLIREFFRQAFLVAARDEMGLATRDAWLGDEMPSQGDNAPWNIATTPGRRFVTELVRGFSQDQDKAKYARHEINRSGNTKYHLYLFEAEKLSRTEYVEALKQAGYTARPNPRNENLAVPAKVEKLLGEMEVVSQFHALRELHQILRTQGESQAIFGALARGYANLGVLTEHCWHPIHKAFKARALLYAQRMVVRDEESPVPRWHRAYAAALTGLHVWAMADLDDAETAWQALPEADRPAKPAWLPLVGALCRYEIDVFEKHLNDADVGQLAAMLKYLTVEAAGCDSWAARTAAEVLKKIPECYRVHDGLCTYLPIDEAGPATTESVLNMDEKLYDHLWTLPSLPVKVCTTFRGRIPVVKLFDFLLVRLFDFLLGKKSHVPDDEDEMDEDDQHPTVLSQFVKEFKDRRQLMDALTATGKAPTGTAAGQAAESAKEPSDSGEPSWAALGVILREVSFMQVYRRAKYQIYVPQDAFGEGSQVKPIKAESPESWYNISAPLVDGHPARPFLDTLAFLEDDLRKAVAQVAEMDFMGSEYPPNIFAGVFSDPKNNKEVYQKLFWNQDEVVRDAALYVRSASLMPGASHKPMFEQLLRISPHSPLARAKLVEQNWSDVKEKAEEWEKSWGHYPAVSYSLVCAYLGLKRIDDAERCYQAAVAVAPADWAYSQQMALLYRRYGKIDRWAEILDNSLRHSSRTPTNRRIFDELAWHFLSRKEWEKALPYTQDFLEARCYEGLQRWEEADSQYRKMSGQYSQRQGLIWYLFCRRTGEGDLEKSRDNARTYVRTFVDESRQSERINPYFLPEPCFLITYYLLDDKPEQALTEIEKATAQNKKTDGKYFSALEKALWTALVADRLKDAEKRDEALHLLIIEAEKAPPSYGSKGAAAAAKLILDDLSRDGEGRIDLDGAEIIGNSIKIDYERLLFHFLLSQYINRRGHTEAADRLGKPCMGYLRLEDPMRTLVGAMLLEHDILPADYQELLQPVTGTDKKPAK